MIAKTCLHCNKSMLVRLNKTKFCSVQCKHNQFRAGGLLSKTLGEVKNLSKKQNAYITIRNHARNIIAQAKVQRKCINCSYEKHVEVAHIKGIGKFEDTDRIATINSLDNLVYLCPNCHWEFDKDRLELLWSNGMTTPVL